MKNLLYLSEPTHSLSSSQLEIMNILFNHNNEHHGITGFLIYDDEHFFQFIEGPDQHIDRLMSNIRKDVRHRISFEMTRYSEQRFFSDWGMKPIGRDQWDEQYALHFKNFEQQMNELVRGIRNEDKKMWHFVADFSDITNQDRVNQLT